MERVDEYTHLVKGNGEVNEGSTLADEVLSLSLMPARKLSRIAIVEAEGRHHTLQRSFEMGRLADWMPITD